MARKRALVVDDSRSARMALQVLLEQHGIEVEFAESGEAAIDFLKGRAVDVIFMDHAMSGMDGLEAVSIIKADPRTAMIPVMMYTAREGEVFVGQARALGAVGVLPKEVKPGVLYEMLLKLGLVEERRARRAEGGETRAPAAREDHATLPRPAENGRGTEPESLDGPLAALITRILQEQHLELRSDILAGNREFARRVAEDIHARQRADAARQAIESRPRRFPGGAATALVLLLALVPALVLFLVLLQSWQERDQLRAESLRLADIAQERASEADALRAQLGAAAASERAGEGGRHRVLEALQWAANQGNQVPFGQAPFDEARLVRLRELLDHLAALGFSGTVRLEAHLGEFCLADDPAGGYRLAEPDTSILDCALLGHPLDGAASPADEQTVGFASFVSAWPPPGAPAIELQVVTHGARDSVRRHPFPPGIRTAGEWNRVAGMNHRVELRLIPAE